MEADSSNPRRSPSVEEEDKERHRDNSPKRDDSNERRDGSRERRHHSRDRDRERGDRDRRSGERDSRKKSNTLYVGKIPMRCSESDIRKEFERFGTIIGVNMKK